MYFSARINTAAFVAAPTDLPKTGLRLAVEEAGVFQGFPASHPWRGSRSQQYQQVGNAVPVGLARACIAEALGL
jgi:DNA (cytosine-5)-methyltransferase 1